MAFIQEVIECHRPVNIIFNVFVFLVPLVFFFVAMIWRILRFVQLVYSAVMLVVIGVRYALLMRKNIKVAVDAKHIISVVSLIFTTMMMQTLRVDYADDSYFVWGLIPGAILACVIVLAAFLLLRNNWGVLFSTKDQRIGSAVLGIRCVLVISVFYCVTAAGTINTVFDGEAVPTEGVVLEKKSTRESRYRIKVELDGKEQWFQVPQDDYRELAEGNVISVEYYGGALGFPYWVYVGSAEQE